MSGHFVIDAALTVDAELRKARESDRAWRRHTEPERIPRTAQRQLAALKRALKPEATAIERQLRSKTGTPQPFILDWAGGGRSRARRVLALKDVIALSVGGGGQVRRRRQGNCANPAAAAEGELPLKTAHREWLLDICFPAVQAQRIGERGLGDQLGGAVDGLGQNRVLMKRGQNIGYQSYMLLFPASRKGIVALTGSDNGTTLATALVRRPPTPIAGRTRVAAFKGF